jgi:polyhydroxyalkanoate synthesis repressor PhaR
VIAHSEKPMIIKKYPDRRLYNTATHTFMTLDDLADLARQDIEFAIHETETGKDITRSVLLHIIVERERKATQNLLPTAFLRQLIRFYGHSMQMIVPVFLDVSLRSFIREQEKLRHPAISASSQETEM